MIDVKWNEKKLNSFYKKMELIINKLPKATEAGVMESLKGIQAKALRFLGTGDENLIQIELIDLENMKIKGRVYTTADWAMFREFGTGQYAEMEHIGTTKTFIQSGYTKWLIPVNKIDRKLNYPIVKIGGISFYEAHGAEPKPFMRPAANEGTDYAIEQIEKALYQMFKEVLT